MQLNSLLNPFKKTDWTLFIASMFLVFFGLAAIYSVALGQGSGQFINFQKQIIWTMIGLTAMFLISNIDYHYWRRWSWVIYLLSLILLILVLTPLGSVVKGTRGWFSLGFMNFQPVEIMKVSIILVLADVCSRYVRRVHRLWQTLLLGLVVFLPLGLVVLQPDFGSAMMLFSIWFASFFFISKKNWHIALILIFVGAWFFLFQDYQKARVMTFIDPSLDPLGSGYNVRQSIIAVGAGRVLGRGLGFGSQSQLKFIPESQTDFIFAVIAEELGFFGVVMLLIFFGIIFYRLYRISVRAPDDFGMFVGLLLLTIIFVQVFINVGMCLGLLPVTGIPLPFVSYGGSFLISIMLLMGVVQNIHKFGVIGRK